MDPMLVVLPISPLCWAGSTVVDVVDEDLEPLDFPCKVKRYAIANPPFLPKKMLKDSQHKAAVREN